MLSKLRKKPTDVGQLAWVYDTEGKRKIRALGTFDVHKLEEAGEIDGLMAYKPKQTITKALKPEEALEQGSSIAASSDDEELPQFKQEEQVEEPEQKPVIVTDTELNRMMLEHINTKLDEILTRLNGKI